jgi:hypothetical protein
MVMSEAFDAACEELTVAKTGVLDPVRLREAALIGLQGRRATGA